MLCLQNQCFAISNPLKMGVIFRYFCFRMTKSQTVSRFWLKRCFCSSAEPIRLCFQQRLVVISSVVILVIPWETVNSLPQMCFWAVERGVFTFKFIFFVTTLFDDDRYSWRDHFVENFLETITWDADYVLTLPMLWASSRNRLRVVSFVVEVVFTTSSVRPIVSP